jgi:hypothetical protein
MGGTQVPKEKRYLIDQLLASLFGTEILNALTTSYLRPVADPRRTNVFVHILQRLTVFPWFPTIFITQGGLEWLASQLLPPEDPNTLYLPPLLDAAEILRYMFFLPSTNQSGFEHLSLSEIERLLCSRLVWEYWQIDIGEGKELVRGCRERLGQLAEPHELSQIALICQTLLEDYRGKWVEMSNEHHLISTHIDAWCDTMSDLIRTLKGGQPVYTGVEGAVST